jgi:hypothetical protein
MGHLFFIYTSGYKMQGKIGLNSKSFTSYLSIEEKHDKQYIFSVETTETEVVEKMKEDDYIAILYDGNKTYALEKCNALGLGKTGCMFKGKPEYFVKAKGQLLAEYNGNKFEELLIAKDLRLWAKKQLPELIQNILRNEVCNG